MGVKIKIEMHKSRPFFNDLVLILEGPLEKVEALMQKIKRLWCINRF